LAGTLRLTFATGFSPVLGQQFTLLSATSVSGNFTNVIAPTVGTNGLGLVISSTGNSLVATATNFAPRLNSPALTMSSNLQFSIAGVAGNRYVLQTSTNLAGWLSLVTNLAPFTFATNFSVAEKQRFYRALYLP
jgi:hypothetical protein